ncbi:MAG: hypothetical protein HY960_13860 [Ignavibacteriae bacterium]|nr:hypothetical protein [Ignavibacteriota bacterium]
MEKHKEKTLRGTLSYSVTDEQIAEYKKIPISERLRWLEEAKEFMYKTLSLEKWETLQKFRRGEL